MYDLEQLRKFCILAKTKSFTKAANELYISQPAITKAIKSLEEQLGIKLFKRTKRIVELTNEGLILFNLINPKIEYISNLGPIIESFKIKNKQDLRIGCNASITRFILTPVLKEFLDNNPNINLQIKNKSTYDLIELLKKKELDFLVVNLPIKDTTGLQIYELKNVQDVFVASKKYEYLKDVVVPIEELKGLPIITNSEGSVTRDHFNNYCLSNNIKIMPHIETVRQSILSDLCILGLGISFTTKEFIEKEIENGDLFVLDVSPKVPGRSIGIVTLNQPKPKFIVDLIDELLEKFKTN